MKNHLRRCPKYPYALCNDPSQRLLGSVFKKDGKGSNLAIAPLTFDVEECRKALATFVIIDEQPFKAVKGYGFKHLLNKLQPLFHMPSRYTVARDCFQLFLDEKIRVRSLLQSDCARVCITTDCWTSVQNLNYMVVTAHFIDNDWTLQKKILNFCLIPNHKGETIGKQIEMCLHDWGIKKLFTVTMDNASSNDVALTYLKKRMRANLVLDGEILHVRYAAHILNLIVGEGLKEMHDSINAIHNAIRFVRSSPSRWAKFKSCIEHEHIASKSLVCLDVPTRWNSTYLMLEAALKFQVAFDRLKDDDSSYRDYFLDSKVVGLPTTGNWDDARVFAKFLKIFYDVTLALSGTLYVTANNAYPHLFLVQCELKQWSENADILLSKMGFSITTKFNKYWGEIDKMNPLLFIATVLDPRHKIAYVKWSFDQIYDTVISNAMIDKVKGKLQTLYHWYVHIYGKTNAARKASVDNVECESREKDNVEEKTVYKAYFAAFKSHLREKNSIEAENEVERYLAEACVDADERFDILGWWKINVSQFPTLSCIVRDVLAIPISIVASKSAFSTGGRVLDVFRVSLSPKMAEALICAQNWLRPTIFQIDIEDHPLIEEEQYEKIETEVAVGGVGVGAGASAEQPSSQVEPMAVDID